MTNPGRRVFRYLAAEDVGTSTADAVAMFDAAEKANRVLYIGQTSRWGNRMQAAKRFIDAGRLGVFVEVGRRAGQAITG